MAREKSPYLLQHQHNPVDWFPWGEEAFEKARAENKPVFLSIGYSTCHWCHVMERESFENESIAELLNRDFVPIKVDREERPDVDRIYMNFVQATTGHGGWPLNVFLTPSLKPFFGGTYWPPERKHGRSSLPDILSQVAEVWRTRQQELLTSADSIHEQIRAATATNGSGKHEPSPQILDKAAGLFKSIYDPQYGGFGSAPKFPQPSLPQFLLRHAARTGDVEAAKMVLHTCDGMAAGGMYDQLGGGFARYSVDAEWLVPHFEKMLYDNAQLAHLYLDAFTWSGEERYAATVRGILDYILRDMTHPEGGFYSAEDADSEGHEGKFYCWTIEEIQRLLSPEEAEVAIRCYGISKEGNFVDHSHPAPLQGQNVLSLARSTRTDVERQTLEKVRDKLLTERSKRVRPHLDDKVLASWNGLMLGAMARAGVILSDARYLSAAEKNLSFLKTHFWHEGRLYHRWREGERDSVELVESHAFMLDGLLHLYEATLNARHLAFGLDIADQLIETFYDEKEGGFWQARSDKDLILRMKPDYDGAEPSGNSVAILALFKLARITDRQDLLEKAEKSLRFFADRLNHMPQALPFMLQALEFSLFEPSRVVVTGDPDSDATRRLLHAVHGVYHPNKVVLGTEAPAEGFAQSLRGNSAQVFLCTGTECRAPESSEEEVRRLLEETRKV